MSRISWKYSFFSLLLFVASMVEKLCTSLSDLYPSWEEGDRVGRGGAVTEIVLAGAESIQAQECQITSQQVAF